MSWFSNQWNRWNQSAPSAWSDVEWLDVVYGRQRYATHSNCSYQVTLPQIEGALTLGHLRQELATVFSLPIQQVLVAFQGLFLKDDRVSLHDYDLRSGSRITLLARDAYVQQAQARAQKQAQNAPQGTAAGGPSAQDAESLPSAAPTMAPVRTGAPAAPPAQDAGAGAPGAADAPSHLEQIAQVSQHCQRDLVPELELLEKTVDALPDSLPGALQSQVPEDVSDEARIPPQRIPLTQRKLSELLLRELLKLDGFPTDSEEVRNTRKATVKNIQAYLDRVDAAWGRATQAKGIVSDV
ncbi:hypothetical protein MCAP1_002570 [Malassezia caprae]|uniref:BAG domain-containing protein n=1 Tax=Malassezia caprae TaxID=1381934 RepID=A0AAF0ECM2_9BASI|nr:hypothetical protein MCAP1_002570 [Malassezia caprae]